MRYLMILAFLFGMVLPSQAKQPDPKIDAYTAEQLQLLNRAASQNQLPMEHIGVWYEKISFHDFVVAQICGKDNASFSKAYFCTRNPDDWFRNFVNDALTARRDITWTKEHSKLYSKGLMVESMVTLIRIPGYQEHLFAFIEEVYQSNATSVESFLEDRFYVSSTGMHHKLAGTPKARVIMLFIEQRSRKLSRAQSSRLLGNNCQSEFYELMKKYQPNVKLDCD